MLYTKIIIISLASLVLLVTFQNCGQMESRTLTAKELAQKCLRRKSMISQLSTQSWYMEELLEGGTFLASNSNKEIETMQVHDSINEAYIGVNGWALNGGIISDAHVLWEIEDSTGELALQWFIGGYNKHYRGLPAYGWGSHRGGNDVKAYPRIGIGSASGQPFVSWGVPNNVPSKTTAGVKHVDQELVSQKVGLPARVVDLPKIDFNVHSRFSGGNKAVPNKDRYGNYFLAVDSYYHDIDTPARQLHPSMAGTVNGINDSSGEIFGTHMRYHRAVSSKRWAMMIWYGEPAYYKTSGGTVVAEDVDIGGILHTVKYKLEAIGQSHPFHYAAFIMNRSTEEVYNAGLQPTVTYNEYAEYFTDGRYQADLDAYMQSNGNLKDLDGVFRKIQAPTSEYVLSDLNLGVEILSNPDTPSDLTERLVRINFRKLSFSVEGKGEFGFRGDNLNPEEEKEEPIIDEGSLQTDLVRPPIRHISSADSNSDVVSTRKIRTNDATINSLSDDDCR